MRRIVILVVCLMFLIQNVSADSGDQFGIGSFLNDLKKKISEIKITINFKGIEQKPIEKSELRDNFIPIYSSYDLRNDEEKLKVIDDSVPLANKYKSQISEIMNKNNVNSVKFNVLSNDGKKILRTFVFVKENGLVTDTSINTDRIYNIKLSKAVSVIERANVILVPLLDSGISVIDSYQSVLS